MIIAKTKLNVIPKTCIECKFCNHDGKLISKSVKANGYIKEVYIQKRCFITGVKIPYVYNAAEQKWEYTKCKSCPLKEVE